MTKPQRVLLEFVTTSEPVSVEIAILDAMELADLYVDAAYIECGVRFVADEHWLQKKRTQNGIASFSDFVSPLFRRELAPVYYLQELFQNLDLAGVKAVAKRALILEKQVIEFIRTRSNSEQRNFASRALQLMSKLFELEASFQAQNKVANIPTGISMYRTFDRLDEVFDLSYEADYGMKIETIDGGERLYEGAGVGVQSGYSTVLTALSHLKMEVGARFIDLGSGYGRVGLAVGLLRPDIDFIGYEYVPHRVDISCKTTERMGLQSHVRFHTQDLSLKDFKIPEAEIYYMYDPFSADTYGHVLSQLVEISKSKKIVIVTKGNARSWLLEIARREGWSAPQEFDAGNLCMFFTA